MYFTLNNMKGQCGVVLCARVVVLFSMPASRSSSFSETEIFINCVCYPTFNVETQAKQCILYNTTACIQTTSNTQPSKILLVNQPYQLHLTMVVQPLDHVLFQIYTQPRINQPGQAWNSCWFMLDFSSRDALFSLYALKWSRSTLMSYIDWSKQHF